MRNKKYNNKIEVVEILKTLLGKKVIYSRAGGGNGSILLQSYQNDIHIWAYSYWEVSRQEKLIATAYDDITPISGTVAVGAKIMEGKYLLGFSLFSDLSIWLFFEDDIDYVIFPQDIEENFLSWEIDVKAKGVVYELNENLKLIVKPYE